MVKRSWKRHIKTPPQDADYYEGFFGKALLGRTLTNDKAYVRRTIYQAFPEPTGINISMMPFVVSTDFEKTKLPDCVKPYEMMIRNTVEYSYGLRNRYKKDLEGKIFFLTIHEGFGSQRRAGLHIDNPGPLRIWKAGCSMAESKLATGFNEGSGSCCTPEYVQEQNGGVYMAVNSTDLCQVWDCKIVPDEDSGDEIIFPIGDIEHLRAFLPEEKSQWLQRGWVYWTTDRTPKDLIKLTPTTSDLFDSFQLFKIVTCDVGLWFVDDYTANPNGVLPDSAITKLVKGSRCESDYFEELS